MKDFLSEFLSQYLPFYLHLDSNISKLYTCNKRFKQIYDDKVEEPTYQVMMFSCVFVTFPYGVLGLTGVIFDFIDS